MDNDLQKSKGDVGMTVKLFSTTILKAMPNEKKTPKQKPIKRGIPEINLGNPKYWWFIPKIQNTPNQNQNKSKKKNIG